MRCFVGECPFEGWFYDDMGMCTKHFLEYVQKDLNKTEEELREHKKSCPEEANTSPDHPYWDERIRLNSIIYKLEQAKRVAQLALKD